MATVMSTMDRNRHCDENWINFGKLKQVCLNSSLIVVTETRRLHQKCGPLQINLL